MGAIARAVRIDATQRAGVTVRPLVSLVLLSGLTGIAFQLAMPPLSFWPLVFVLWAPLLRSLHDAPRLVAAGSGALFGLCGFLTVPLAVLPWGAELYLGGTAINVGMFAAVFLLTSLCAPRLRPRWRWLAFPTAWVVVHLLANYVLEWPMALSLALVERAPALTAVANVLGVVGLEFLIASSSSLLAAVWSRQISLARFGAAQAALWTLLLSWSQVNPIQSSASIPIALVQPAFSFAEEQAAQWSLAARNRMEKHLDTLIAQAAQRSPALIVTPEGGNELLNRRLQRRTAALSALLRDRPTKLLLGGRDLTPQGDQYNTVSLFDATGFVAEAHKSHTVMGTERNIDRGRPTVFDLGSVKAGISICFEAIFEDHAYALARGGAQVVLVVSDDVSFGRSVLESWHAAFALLRGIEIGRSVVLLMNHGPAVVTDPTGRILHRAASGTQPGVHHWDVPLTDTPALSVLGGRWFCLALILGSLIFAWQRSATPSARFESSRLRRVLRLGSFISAKRPTPEGQSDRGRGVLREKIALVPRNTALMAVFASVVMAVTGNAIFLFGLSALRTNGTMTSVWNDAVARYRGSGATDGIAPLFKQSSERSCGAAALAYVLTTFGDLVFEEQLVASLSLPDSGYSFADLRRLAQQRGFDAQGFQAAAEDLPRRGAPPVITHFKNGHFVVVLREQDARVFYFDPALGRTLHVETSTFLQQWSGFMLQVSTV